MHINIVTALSTVTIVLFSVAGVHTLSVQSLSATSLSKFHGAPVQNDVYKRSTPTQIGKTHLTMRKQKASDRRTRRRQRGDVAISQDVILASIETLTKSPMSGNSWKHKDLDIAQVAKERTSGRGRSRKRSALYNSLSFYHSKFLNLLTAEYRSEEEEVLGRIKASLDDPIGLEVAGYALFDLFPERRGNLYSDEVYRLVKAHDATTAYPRNVQGAGDTETLGKSLRYLPPNHKFSVNDVILLTAQPQGSGDFFDQVSLPTSSTADSIEARVLNVGPTYLDVAIQRGTFEGAFGPAPNNDGPSGRGDARMRLRADRFFSDIPYQRQVAAISQLTSLPERKKHLENAYNSENPYENISMDELIREVILRTYAFEDESSPLFRDSDFCDIQSLSTNLAKPPMPTSPKLARQALTYMKSNPQVFKKFNGAQISSIEAALTRRMTMIHGPPGSGKTAVAAGVGFGFVHQCRSLSPNTKVLACAFSNVGADNLAEALLCLGLKVVRIGKPSAVSKSLWDWTLDAYIDNDPDAQKALRSAERATAQLSKMQRRKRHGKTIESSKVNEQILRTAATSAVKASIKASNIAATKALRQADVIVSTATGAADPRLLAACGIISDQEELLENDRRLNSPSTNRKSTIPGLKRIGMELENYRFDAPDRLPPLSLPFVIIDEACQSVEAATLIPITSTNSCRSLVLFGDPCQLPPTVRSQDALPLSTSLMERLAATLPHPSNTAHENIVKDETYIDSLPIKQARSVIHSSAKGQTQQASYRKRYGGSLLLSVQYRMHPSIAAFPSAVFYDGLLSTPSYLADLRPFPSMLEKSLTCGIPNLGVRMVNVGGRCNERRGTPTRFSRTVYGKQPNFSDMDDQTSYWNEPEAQTTLSIVRKLIADSGNNRCDLRSIGIVTPYSGQVRLIKEMITEDDVLRSFDEAFPESIEVNTVDGYQGRERDVIIFSAVRSNRQGRIGFLRDWRRMNVAVTRSKAALIVIGDLETLVHGDKHWAAFVKWCKGVSCILDHKELQCSKDIPQRSNTSSQFE